MNPNQCRVALRPRGALEVFDLTAVFVHAHLGVFARLAAVLLAGPAVGFALACWAAAGSPWLLALPLPLFGLVQAPFTLVGGRLLFRPDPTALDALRETARSAGALVGASVAALGGLAAAGLTCGTMLVPTMAALLYVPETALLEREPLARAVARSQRLASAGFGTALIAVVSRLGLTAWGALVCEAGGQLVVDSALQLGRPFGALVDGQVTAFLLTGALAAQPIFALYRLLLYVDVRTRTEGWDLQVALRAAALAREGRR